MAPEDVAGTPEFDQEKYNAAVLLETASLDIRADQPPTRFLVDVGFNNSHSGTLACRLKPGGYGFELSVGYTNDITDNMTTTKIFHALNDHPDLLTVYYEPGHAYVEGRILFKQTQIAHFPRWRFEDFAGYDVTKEKPPFDKPQEIHEEPRLRRCPRLKERLLQAPVGSPASWVDGKRCDDRSEFVEMLDARSARDQFRVVIVQPQVGEGAYLEISDADRAVDRNTLQLYRLETLLNSARGSVVAIGGDLDVVGRRG
ncbi:hypothetical protein [Umezawaea tangerina]|nr:hypothetical protein [Umezawaea tangerina]